MRIGLIGCGNMGISLAANIIEKLRPEVMVVFDRYKDKQQLLVNRFKNHGLYASGSFQELIDVSDIVILAVKPQDMEGVLKGTKRWQGKIVISIAAGLKLALFESWIGSGVGIVRAMPNFNALIAQSVTALSFNGFVEQSQKALAEKIFRSVGDVVFVKEGQMDAVTATSGSGPAFIAYLREFDDVDLKKKLKEAAQELGIDAKTAEVLASVTISGTREILKINFDPDVLIKRVSSPGGTTEAGMKVLEAHFEKTEALNALKEAVKAACKRAAELAKG